MAYSNVEVDDFLKMNPTSERLISIIAHEIRNSFNSINGISSLILNDDFKADDSVKELIALIKSTSTKSSDLLENLLYLTKINSEEFPLTQKLVNINNLIIEIVDFYLFQIEQKKISIKLNLDHEHEVKVNENIFSFVLRNLITNAIKFSKTKGKIEISYFIENNEISLTVKDNGIGMDKTTIDKIINHSVLNSSRGTIGENGTGLGLKLCLEFINKAKGRLQIKSNLGEGSTFKVFLPIEY